jgi:hypothetical protein
LDSLASAAGRPIEERLGAPALYYGVSHLVGLLLVAVPDLPDAAIEAHTRALLHHMSGFVGRGGQAG